MTSALSTIAIPADPVAGTPARTVAGGLMYAGVDGNKTYQGNAPAVKWSPRVGAVYAVNDRTVLRGGYGLYWAPFNYPIPSTSASNYGQVGFSQNTILTSSRGNPTTFENPFPNGIELPSGNIAPGADQSRQQHQLRRSEPFGAARPSVLGRPAAPAARQHGADHELHGRTQRPHRARRIERHRREHQPARSEVSRARLGGARRTAAQSVPRQPERAAIAVDAGDAVAGPSAPAVPAVRPDQRPAGHRRPQPVSRGGVRAHQADGERFRRPLQLHLQPAERQPGRGRQLLRRGQPGPAGEQLQLHPVDAGVRGRPGVHDRLLRSDVGVRPQHARRAAPRAALADRPVAVRRRQAVGERTRGGSADRRMDDRGDDHAAERIPDQRAAGARIRGSGARTRTGRT